MPPGLFAGAAIRRSIRHRSSVNDDDGGLGWTEDRFIPRPHYYLVLKGLADLAASVFDRHGFETEIEASAVSGDASAGVASRHLKGPGN
jgi:hypothetical protein